ncbi:DUF4333 domain-containing protein [Merismopedia glauca]|uniref:DUF4333 domain-containing protein n=1 Tax=Merismopedia glauca CCAP 1448/3 TaxID=1296344 RepID=A0A2T1C3U0_9CYAN|nr:DUF4333 domain-containing protein [Merismopedia glauca]PSB02884.1 hypothetical protein C7B64_10980 [Merismopedia glauca CCAP 1448/3]
MLFNYYWRKVGVLGLAIALTSCNNSTQEKPTQVIVTQTTSPPENTTVFDPIPTTPPVTPITQISPKPRPKKSPSSTNSGEIPIIIEGDSPNLTTSTSPNNSSKLDTESLETEVKNSLSTELGLTINSVKCPNLASVTKGKKSVCSVVTPDGNFSVKLTNKGKQFEYEPQGAINITELESNIEASVKNRQGEDVKATCSGEVLIFNSGDYLNCQVKNQEGKSQSATITFNNLTGDPNGITVKILGRNSTSSTTKPQKKTPTVAANSQAATKNSEKLEKSLKTLLSKDIGTTIRSVNCPDKVEKNFSKSYTCQAVTGQGKFSLVVKLTNPKGGFKYQAKGILIPTKLGETISQEVENSTGKKVEVDCGETLIIFTPGESLGCQISTGKGEPQNIKVTIQDEYGKKVKVDYNLAG